MAAATAKRRYGQGAVYGSLAYDFNNPELYAGEEYSAPQRERTAGTQTQTRTQVRTRARAVPRTRQGIAPTAIIGMLVAAFLLVTGITAQVQLMRTSGDSVELTEKLSTLQAEQAKLRIRYESAFNLSEIEEYATGTLGMQKPTADQISYIDTSAPDRAVVLSTGESDSFVDRAADFLSGLGAYFK